ncbi:MAG: prephenate dehydrogenase [Clostridia bacterium]|nr:prephenate dehydrogenase [Clostridia bacterium]
MIVDTTKRILIVGLGLIGGSYAAGLKRFGFHISAIDRDQTSIDYALQEGIIDEGSCEVDEETVRRADLVIFAIYPEAFVEWIKEYGHLFSEGTLLTDVTGVKSPIVSEIQELLGEGVEFVAAHPMAGREVSGVQNSSPSLFFGANYIVTPTEKNTPEGIESCLELGRLLGFSNVTTLTPEEHDEMIGFLSQLTHCIAITLMTCNDKEDLERFTGDSFRDLTRIARINDRMWSELFLLNRDALLAQMDLFSAEFERLKQMLKDSDVDGMRQMMRRSTERRALFDRR